MDNWKEDIIKERLGGKKDWTNAERMELSEQLDREIEKKFDEMVSGKSNNGSKRPKDAWTEDNWKDKMAEHPIFAGLTADGDKDVSLDPNNTLAEGLAQVKFDPDNNSPLEIAQNYKEDGIHHFKYKKYNLAVANFSEGLAQNFKDNELRAQLLNNRAAAHYRIGNYRQAIRDCEQAVSLKPDYRKAIQRAAESCDRLGCWQELERWADRGLLLDPGDRTFNDLRIAAVHEQHKCEKITRKKQMEDNHRLQQLKKLLKAIEDHGVTLEKVAKKTSTSDDEDEEESQSAIEKEIAALPDLEPEHPTARGCRVQLNKAGELVWPVLLLYPEHQQTDFIQHFNEKHTFCEQLEVVFGDGSPPAPWDRARQYSLGRLCVYFEAGADGLVQVPLDVPLRQLLCDDRLVVRCGTPAFLICVAESPYQHCLEGRYRRVTRLD